MKILIFNWQDIRNPQAGGAEVHMQEIFSRVAGLGHEVTLFCSTFPGAPGEETVGGIRVIREGGRYLFNWRVPLRYRTRFRREHFDVVIDNMNKIPFFTPLYVREPLWVLVHHLFDKSIFNEAPYPFALYVYLMEKLGVAIARWKRTPVMVVSESTKAEMMAHGIPGERMTLVPNCVDHEIHTSGSTDDKSLTPLIGYFGRLKKYKSADHLLRAFARIRPKHTDLRLVIIGEGDYRKTLEALSHELGIDNAVQFTGFIDIREKVRWLQKMWFMVNTSAKEGWGLTVIEANACGTPVIASNVPGLRDAVKDRETGILYPYGDIDELASLIELLLADKVLRDRLRENAIAWARTFDWLVVARGTIRILEEGRRQASRS